MIVLNEMLSTTCGSYIPYTTKNLIWKFAQFIKNVYYVGKLFGLQYLSLCMYASIIAMYFQVCTN